MYLLSPRLPLGVVTFCLILFLLSEITSVAEFIDRFICFPIRIFFSSLNGLFAFPLFELAVALSPLLIVFLLCAVRNGAYCLPLFLLAFLIFCYTSVLAIPAKKEKTHPDIENLSDDAFFEAATRTIELLALETEESENEKNREELSIIALKLASVQSDNTAQINQQPAIKVKSSLFPGILDRLNIYGYLAFPTAEIIVSPNLPKVLLPITVAHEVRHFMGSSREEEAVFESYLCCVSSDDRYVRYCAHLYAYRKISAVLYNRNPELYFSLLNSLPKRVRDDIVACNSYESSKRDSRACRASEKLNDLAIKMRDSRGKASYSYSCALIADYITSQ